MSYRIALSKNLENWISKLKELAWINRNLIDVADPRKKGKGLTVNHKRQWPYRIGNYRLICLIDDDRLVILALSVGHRRDDYDSCDYV